MRTLAETLPPARWVRPEGLHLTLAFLGETEPDRLPALNRAAGEAARSRGPVGIAVTGGGTFPPRRPARVAWLGLAGGELLAPLLASVSEAACSALAIEQEARPFHPHVTVARPKKPWNREACDLFARKAARSFGERFAVTEVTLFESRLGAGGARYTALERYPLGGG